MTIKAKVKRQVEFDGVAHEQVVDQDVEASAEADLTIPDGTTDQEVQISFPNDTKLKALHLQSDQDVDIKSNDTASPDDSFTLPGGKPSSYVEGDLHNHPFQTAAVSKLFVSNSSGAEAKVKIRAGYDSTP